MQKVFIMHNVGGVRIGGNDTKEATTMDKSKMLILEIYVMYNSQLCDSQLSEYNQHIEKSLFKTFPITNFCC